MEYFKLLKTPIASLTDKKPFVSILVPAHNEEVVIVKTILSLLSFDYPKDSYEIIVINDNSDDNSAELLRRLQNEFGTKRLKVINTTKKNGGKGKSNALNIGLKYAKGEIISVYDADNTPQKNALSILVSELVNHPKLGAVIGKFRTRNRNASLLTRFINIETLAFQWMAQAGRQHLFGLCTIPGTNYVIRRSVLDEIGGWDVKALAEDTEISFRVYQLGYQIKFQPAAVTWEQEPQTLEVWIPQRTRWVKGNIYVIVKNAKLIFTKKGRPILFDLLYFLSTYFILMSSLVLSDSVFVLSVAGLVHSDLQGFSNGLWIFGVFMFVISTFLTITTEKGEANVQNIFLILLMYLVYSQMWLLVAVKGMVGYVREKIFHQEAKWYKTKRYQ